MNKEKFKNTVQELKKRRDYEGLYNMIWKTSSDHEIETDRKIYLIETLEEIGNEKAMETIAKIISVRPTDYGEFASKALLKMTPHELAVKYAIEAYERGESPKSSINGVNLKASLQLVISSLGEEAVEPLLNILTNEKKSGLSNLISDLLYSCITVNSIDLLKKRLLYPERWIREIITNALIYLKWEPSTIEEKVTVYISKYDWKELEKLGEPAVEYLVESMDIQDVCLIKRKPKIINVLGKIGSSKAVDSLILSLNNNSNPKSTIKALGEIGSPQIITPIFNHIRSENHFSFLINSSIYVNALSNIGKPAQNELNKAQYDSNRNVREIAKKTLKRLV